MTVALPYRRSTFYTRQCQRPTVRSEHAERGSNSMDHSKENTEG